jgi:hypothetical protein
VKVSVNIAGMGWEEGLLMETCINSVCEDSGNMRLYLWSRLRGSPERK